MSWSPKQEAAFRIFCWAIFFAVVFGIAAVANYVRCHAKASAQELECSYMPFQGCMVKIDGKWIDYDRLRVME